MRAQLALFVCLGSVACLWGQAPEPATITATGIGRVKVKADAVRISFSLFAQAETIKEAREKVAGQARKVSEGLRHIRHEVEVQQGPGVAESVPPREPFGFERQPKIKLESTDKFRASHTFVVEVRNAEPEQLRAAAARILDLAVEHDAVITPESPTERTARLLGQSEGPRVQFFRENHADAQRKALAEATANALANAQAIAEGAKVKVADIVAIGTKELSWQPTSDSASGRRASSTDLELSCVVEVKVRIQK